MTFEEFYRNLGLEKYPFNVFTAEKETDVLDKIYLKFPNQSLIGESIKSGSTIVIGERGSGKTALSVDLQKEILSKDTLIVQIDEFSDLPIGHSTDQLYRFLTSRISVSLFAWLTERNASLWRLKSEDRYYLSYYLHEFVGSASKRQLEQKISSIQNGPLRKLGIGLYNSLRGVLNYGLKAGTKVVSDAISRHFSALPEIGETDLNYFRKIETETDLSFDAQRRSYFYLEKICSLARACGVKSVFVFIDKVDEDPRFDNDAEKIGDYVAPICSDNKIMSASFMNIVLFVWTTPFNYIKERVRTNKLGLHSLDWQDKQLHNALDQRIKAYSASSSCSINALLDEGSSEGINIVFEMCNRNPRDLWHIMNSILRSQYAEDPSKKVSSAAIQKGIDEFVRKFNYYEYYPKRQNARANTMDVYRYINHLLKLDSVKFTKDKLNNLAGTGGSTNNYVVQMQNIGLIKMTSEKAQGGAVVYEIADPKVRYAMNNGLQIGD
jgi:hypothetical protein